MVLLQHHGGHRALRLLGARATAAALVAAALCSCSGGTAPVAGTQAAITNGAPTDGDVGVAALLRGDTLVCTATLVAPRVLLTAAHCLPDGPAPDAYFGSAPSAGGTRVAIIAHQRHPAYDATLLTHDVALALLGQPSPAGASAAALPAAPLDAGAVGLALRLVGFGRTDAADTSAPHKRVGTAMLASLTPTTFDFAPTPSQTCEGDSGGPAFATVGGVEAIVGVTSSGDPGCTAMAHDQRVDAYTAAFIAPFLAATADGAADAGARCWYAENCAAAAGSCTAALDDPSLSFCAPPCAAGDVCPAGLRCLPDRDGRRLCRHTTPSPGALGADCSDASACLGGQCVARAGGNRTVCAPSCFRDLPGFCAAGFECATVAGAAGSSACFASARRGGCALGGAGGDERSGLVALALWAAWLAQRRRRRLRR